MDNNGHIPDLVHAFSYVEMAINPGFIASYTHLYNSQIEFHHIDNDVWTELIDIIGKTLKDMGTAVNIVL